MTNTEQQFVQLIKSAVLHKEPPQITDWMGIWTLAIRHHLEVLIYDAVKNDLALPGELREQMSGLYHRMAARSLKQAHCIEQIEASLKKAELHYAIVKGGLLRLDYPIAFSRYMSDIDFYIQPADRPAIRKAMESIGGVFRGKESGDEQFLFWDSVGVEFHGRLCYRRTNSGIENYPEWDFVDESIDRLKEEGFALNLIGHAVHDLAGAGPGIRYILDLWIYRNRHQPQPDWERVDDRLRKDGIYQAAHNLLNLSEYLFGNGEENALMAEMAEYVLKGGLYGDYKRGLKSQAADGKAIRHQLFRNRTEFENRYPWLEKYPVLLPVAWICRLFQSLKKHTNHIKKWKKGLSNISIEEVEAHRAVLRRFGL